MDEQEFLQELVDAGTELGQIPDEDSFRGIFDAFRAGDRDSYQRLLGEFKISDRCELVCGWIRSKECVLLCFELCGPPLKLELPDPREFAQLVVKLASDEELVERLAETVQQRDGAAFRALLAQFQMERFCHLVCHWLCTVHTLLQCRIVCGPEPVPPIYLAEELTASARVLGQLLENGTAFENALKAATVGNCELVRSILVKARLGDNCQLVCEWFCSWHCVEVCSTLCLPFDVEPAAPSLSEAFEFAQFTAKLAGQPDVLGKLATAVTNQNAADFGALLKELDAVRYCRQICHWICSWHCVVLCRCVCKPVLQPWFTNIGFFDIYADIDPATGLTNKGLGYLELAHHGGPNFAFTGGLELRGYCPIDSPIDGTPMRYRFVVTPSGAKLTGSHVHRVQVGQRRIFWPDNSGGVAAATTSLQFQSLVVDGTLTADTPPPAVGDPWFGPVEHIITPDPDGWITVDPGSISGGFTTLIGFETGAEVSGGDPNSGVVAGHSIPSANVKNGTVIGLTFEATRVSGPTSPPDFTNSVAAVYVNNWQAINRLNIAQFIGTPTLACTPITSNLDVLYTTDHELMAAWSAEITSSSVSAPGPFNLGTTPRGVSTSTHFDTSGWHICSYVAKLTTRAARTTGLIDELDSPNQLTFCVGKKDNIN